MFYSNGCREIEVGDKVLLRNSGNVTTTHSYVLSTDEDHVTVPYWGGVLTLNSVTGGHWTIAPETIPIPTKKNAVIKIDDRIYIRTKPNLAQPWQEAGRGFVQSDMAIQAGADRYGHEVIFEGRDDS